MAATHDMPVRIGSALRLHRLKDMASVFGTEIMRVRFLLGAREASKGFEGSIIVSKLCDNSAISAQSNDQKGRPIPLAPALVTQRIEW